jgi:hypothetical protein
LRSSFSLLPLLIAFLLPQALLLLVWLGFWLLHTERKRERQRNLLSRKKISFSFLQLGSGAYGILAP